MVGARFLEADFMRINLACEATTVLAYTFFLHSLEGAEEYIVIATQERAAAQPRGRA
jgi:hypothetical protein